MRDRSASSSRHSGRLATGCLLLSLFGAMPVPPARGGMIEAQLDQILRGAGAGVVRIDVRRPWRPDTERPTAHGTRRPLPTRRIQGNGLVWDGVGHIVTVADLAQPGDTIRVFGPDGTMARGEFLAQNSDLGISLLRVQGISSLTALPRGGPLPSPLSWVLTIVYPGTAGSARSSPRLSVARTAEEIAYRGHVRGRLEGVSEPGVAGGGVLNGDGTLLGILLGEGSESLLLRDERRGRPPVEYAIGSPGPSEAGWILSVDRLQETVAALLQPGRVGQGFLGVRVDVPGGQEGSRAGPGVSIASVLPGSPAALAGMLPGDRLVGFDGVPVLNWDELTQRVASIHPGQTVRVDLTRAGREVTLSVQIEDRAHSIWRQKQRQRSSSREKMLRHQIEGLRQQLDLLHHELLSVR